MRELVYTWAGTVAYDTALAWQERLVELRMSAMIPDVLLALEHPPTYTLGTRTMPMHIPSPAVLQQFGAVLRQTGRGGSVTYHGPGQLVGYCIMHLSACSRDLHLYLRGLEEALIATLSEWGIAAHREDGLTGVWVAGRKIASIGVKVSHWVAWHGFALNLDPDMAAFRAITPCGISGREMTSVVELGIRPPAPECVTALLAGHLARVFGHTCRAVTPSEVAVSSDKEGEGQ